MAGWGRDERVDDVFFEDVAGDPTEEGQLRRTGNDLKVRINGEVKSITAGAGSLPAAGQLGQVLYSIDGSTFSVQLPLTSRHGWLVNDDGEHIVVG